MKERKKAILVLSDGTVFEGFSFGADGEATGEVVFNTSLMGYQEILTDPSYKGQMVTMTYTEQGNYGINLEDVESRRPWVGGFIVKQACQYPSSWRHEKKGGMTLDAYLKENNIVGIYGIDTRALTRHIREEGAMPGVISSVDLDAESLYKKAVKVPSLAGQDLAKDVTCSAPYEWTEGVWDITDGYTSKVEKSKFKVVAFDFGIKLNILRSLVSAGCDVTVVPADTTAEKILEMNPDGIFLSNGPGDPEPVKYAQETIKKLIGKKPIFGICLGHQLLSLALGGKSFKLKFGHRGGNQPVMDLTTRKVEITSQNHGFAIDADSMKGIAELTHINLNDKTVEGIQDKDLKLFTVQYHPEASPGPHDSQYLFKRFTDMMG
jgi:carbamoyl-phosphate synthase small subunit